MTTPSSRVTRKGGGYPTSQSICRMENGTTFLLLLKNRNYVGCSLIYKIGAIHMCVSYVYWTAHHCGSWRIKYKPDVTFYLYFTSYVLNMFRTLIYPSSGACDCSVELPHWSYCSWFDVCWSIGVIGLEWYPCCRLTHSLQHGYHSNPTTPKLQHTSNQEKYDQCGNSTE